MSVAVFFTIRSMARFWYNSRMKKRNRTINIYTRAMEDRRRDVLLIFFNSRAHQEVDQAVSELLNELEIKTEK